jgi:hypothetical protein
MDTQSHTPAFDPHNASQESRRMQLLKEEELRQKKKELELREKELALKKKRTRWLIFFLILIFLCVGFTSLAALAILYYKTPGESVALSIPMLDEMSATQTASPRPLEPRATETPEEVLPSPTITLSPTVTSTQTPEPTITPIVYEPTQSIVPEFLDTFDAGLSTEWQMEYEYAWGVLNGQLVSLEGSTYECDESTYECMVDGIWLGNERWSNYSVDFDVISVVGDCFLLMPQKDAISAVAFGIENDGESANLYWLEVPNSTVEGFAYPFHLQVTLQQSTLAAFVNGAQVSTVTMPTFDHGRVGLVCDYEGSTFDNFRVMPIP